MTFVLEVFNVETAGGNPHLVSIGKEVPGAVATNELTKLSLRLHTRHNPIVKPIVSGGTHKILVGVRDAISIVVHHLLLVV